MLKRAVSSPWFARLDLGIACLCAAAWVLWPAWGWVTLLIAGLPWLARAAVGRHPFRPTQLDLPLAVFLLMAAVGVWASYDPGEAWAKFWLVVASIRLYFALSGQLPSNERLLAFLTGVFSPAVAVYFLLSHDWLAKPADLAFLNRLGVAWMNWRPFTLPGSLYPDIAGGLMAAGLPISIYMLFVAWREKRRFARVGWLGMVFLAGLGLLLASSWAAWLALAGGLGAWGLWVLTARLARRMTRVVRNGLWGFLAAVGVLALGWLVWNVPSVMVLLSSLPGPDNATSRLAIAADTLRLVADYPFTGGGLGAFPGLYSQYMRVLPFYLYGYSHNLYLDVALEQGLLGLAALLVILACSVWLLRPRLEHDGQPVLGLQGAVMVGLLTMILNGFAGDPFYGTRGTPVLFFLPGMAVMLAGASAHGRVSSLATRRWRTALGIFLVVLSAMAAPLLWLRQPLLSAWFADLGAVHMARTQLEDFPTGTWETGENLARLDGASVLLNTALSLNPDNITAHYRLGLLAMMARDFVSACPHLEAANRADPLHNGLRKTLGYCYAWSGRLDPAARLLGDFPESRGELQAYTTWWNTQSRPDLAELARQLMQLTPISQPVK